MELGEVRTQMPNGGHAQSLFREQFQQQTVDMRKEEQILFP